MSNSSMDMFTTNMLDRTNSLIREVLLPTLSQYLNDPQADVSIEGLATALELPPIVVQQVAPPRQVGAAAARARAPTTSRNLAGGVAIVEKPEIEQEFRCIYVMKRGTSRGVQCPNPKEPDWDYCGPCLKKKAVQKDLGLPGAPELRRATPNFGGIAPGNLRTPAPALGRGLGLVRGGAAGRGMVGSGRGLLGTGSGGRGLGLAGGRGLGLAGGRGTLPPLIGRGGLSAGRGSAIQRPSPMALVRQPPPPVNTVDDDDEAQFDAAEFDKDLCLWHITEHHLIVHKDNDIVEGETTVVGKLMGKDIVPLDDEDLLLIAEIKMIYDANLLEDLRREKEPRIEELQIEGTQEEESMESLEEDNSSTQSVNNGLNGISGVNVQDKGKERIPIQGRPGSRIGTFPPPLVKVAGL